MGGGRQHQQTIIALLWDIPSLRQNEDGDGGERAQGQSDRDAPPLSLPEAHFADLMVLLLLCELVLMNRLGRPPPPLMAVNKERKPPPSLPWWIGAP